MQESIENIHCRTLRHPWKVVAVTDDDTDDFAASLGKSKILKLECRSCKSIRIDRIDEHGGLIERNYEYPNGYRLGKNEVRPELEELRLTLMKKHEEANAT